MAYVNTRSVEAGLVARGNSILRAVQDYLGRHAVYRKTLRELEQLTDRELADLGMSRLSIREVAREAAFAK